MCYKKGGSPLHGPLLKIRVDGHSECESLFVITFAPCAKRYKGNIYLTGDNLRRRCTWNGKIYAHYGEYKRYPATINEAPRKCLVSELIAHIEDLVVLHLSRPYHGLIGMVPLAVLDIDSDRCKKVDMAIAYRLRKPSDRVNGPTMDDECVEYERFEKFAYRRNVACVQYDAHEFDPIHVSSLRGEMYERMQERNVADTFALVVMHCDGLLRLLDE